MGGGGGGIFEGGKAGGSKSFGIYHNGCRVVWSLWLSSGLVAMVVERHIVYVRLSSGPPGGRPHARLKAGTPRKAPIPAPTTETPVPATVNRRSTRAEATQRAPTFKLVAWGVKTAPPKEPRVNTEIRRPTRTAKLEPERTTGCESTRGPRPASGTPPDCSGETSSLSEETKAPQQQQLVPPVTRHDTAETACHTPVGRASSGGARCRLCR